MKKSKKTKQSNALKAEFGINPEENSINNTNVRGKGRSRGNVKSRRSGRKAEKQYTESGGQKIKTESQDEPNNDDAAEDREKVEKQSGGQKRKMDGPDDDVATGSRSPTKKSRIGEIAPEVLSSSSERKRKTVDLDDPDGSQGERSKSLKLDITNE